MNIAVTPPELSPLEIDPRPCEWCGLTIDQHIMVEEGEGPEFFCPEVEPDAASLVVQWEMADPRDAWRHTGETPPPVDFRNADLARVPESARQHYRTPQSTIDAFWVITRTGNTDGIADWLANHPRDAQHLHKLWKQKCSTAAAK
jgi:hypothetical protein